MEVRWERAAADVYFGFVGSQQVAQVAHVFSTDHTDLGWVALLSPQEELWDHYRTPDEAMAAAEVALAPDGGQR